MDRAQLCALLWTLDWVKWEISNCLDSLSLLNINDAPLCHTLPLLSFAFSISLREAHSSLEALTKWFSVFEVTKDLRIAEIIYNTHSGKWIEYIGFVPCLSVRLFLWIDETWNLVYIVELENVKIFSIRPLGAWLLSSGQNL